MADAVKFRDLRMSMTFRGNRVETIGGGVRGDTKNIGNIKAEDTFSAKKARIYTLQDYKWTDPYDGSATMDAGLPTPKLILTEFQPEKVIAWGKLIDNLGRATMGLTNLLGGAAGTVVAVGAAVTQDGLIDKYTASINDADQLLNSEGASMSFVQHLLKGQYLSSYEVPFFDNIYFKVDTTGNWASAGAEAMIGQEMARVAQETSNVNFPMSPTWSKTGEDGFDITTEFHLINSNTQELKRNFSFLHAFAAGAFWVQAGLIQFSPNLYDVYCPGRFHKYWCAMGVTVSYEGKQRQNFEFVDFMRKMYSMQGLGSSFTFPEIYKVTINLKDLTPNNFNVWAENLRMGPFGNGQVIDPKNGTFNPSGLIGQTVDSLAKDMLVKAGLVTKEVVTPEPKKA